MSLDNDFENSGNVTFNSGSINVKGKIITENGSNLTIIGATVASEDDVIVKGSMTINSIALRLQKNDGTPDKKITIDDGTFNQAGGIVSTKDMEIKNGGTYNQFSGEFQIEEESKVKSGTPINSFNGTSGTVRFRGEGNGEFYGNVQFHNVIVDADANLKMDNDNDNIKISGNFTNNNPDLDNEKGSITLNGTSPQSIYSASSPASSKTLVGNLIISNSSGINLLSNIGADDSFALSNGGNVNTNGLKLFVNGSEYSGPLPVELTSFSATRIGSKVKLNWKTATEVNNYGFDVERSVISNGERNLSWETIGFVNGNGNSNSPKNYSFEDKNVTEGKYCYTIKQIDNDGQFEYSKTIEVNVRILQ